jgi:DNA-binding transcriptional ArsR family regulator
VSKADLDTCELLCLDLPRAENLRRSRPSAGALVAAAEFAKALADPTRLTVALALRDGGELCVCDLAWVPVRVLRSAGLVRPRREGKMVMYSLSEAGTALLTAVVPASAEVSA